MPQAKRRRRRAQNAKFSGNVRPDGRLFVSVDHSPAPHGRLENAERTGIQQDRQGSVDGYDDWMR